MFEKFWRHLYCEDVTLKQEKCESYWLSWSCNSSWVLLRVDMNDSCPTQTRKTDESKRTLINFKPMPSFLQLCMMFCTVATMLNKKLPKGQPETVNGLAEDKITAFKTVKRRLIEHSVIEPSIPKGNHTIDTDDATNRFAAFYYKRT